MNWIRRLPIWLRESLPGPGASSRREGGARDLILRAAKTGEGLLPGPKPPLGGRVVFWVGNPCGFLTPLSSSAPEVLDPEGAGDGGTTTILPDSSSVRPGFPGGESGVNLGTPQGVLFSTVEAPGGLPWPSEGARETFFPPPRIFPSGWKPRGKTSEGGGGFPAPFPTYILYSSHHIALLARLGFPNGRAGEPGPRALEAPPTERGAGAGEGKTPPSSRS